MLFEHERRGHLWRLEVSDYRGRTFANWRKWYSDGGEWKPTREGCTMPIDKLGELTACLLSYHGLDVPKGLAD